jgi:hypothetical protein
MDRTSHTANFYLDLELAYRFFNARLFSGSLPACLITLQRKHGVGGFFAANRFGQRDQREYVHEIALNPTLFADQTESRILSILVHEMCHVWQHECGKPARGRYHNREWARQMLSIGLNPSHTGKPGGRFTGDRMDHYIVGGGLFDRVCDELLATGSVVRYVERDSGNPVVRERKRASKSPYCCENCELKVWGKPGIKVRCEDCDVIMVGTASIR